jgi:hypothetical protein
MVVALKHSVGYARPTQAGRSSLLKIVCESIIIIFHYTAILVAHVRPRGGNVGNAFEPQSCCAAVMHTVTLIDYS